MSGTEMDTASFRRVLGAYPTGVCVVTALDEENQPTGMVVGTFTSVSLNPPLVGFLPDKNSRTWAKIAKAGHFCVNVLASDQQDLCRQLSGPDKFANVQYRLSGKNLPVLDNTIAWIECETHSVVDAGDHYFVLGTVLAMEVARDDDPMLFHRGRYGGFAELA